MHPNRYVSLIVTNSVNYIFSSGDSSSLVKRVPSVETDHCNNDHCTVWVNGLQGLAYGQLASLGPGQVLPTSVNLYSRHGKSMRQTEFNVM